MQRGEKYITNENATQQQILSLWPILAKIVEKV